MNEEATPLDAASALRDLAAALDPSHEPIEVDGLVLLTNADLAEQIQALCASEQETGFFDFSQLKEDERERTLKAVPAPVREARRVSAGVLFVLPEKDAPPAAGHVSVTVWP